MLEKALTGGKGYWTWIIILLAIIGVRLYQLPPSV